MRLLNCGQVQTYEKLCKACWSNGPRNIRENEVSTMIDVECSRIAGVIRNGHVESVR